MRTKHIGERISRRTIGSSPETPGFDVGATSDQRFRAPTAPMSSTRWMVARISCSSRRRREHGFQGRASSRTRPTKRNRARLGGSAAEAAVAAHRTSPFGSMQYRRLRNRSRRGSAGVGGAAAQLEQVQQQFDMGRALILSKQISIRCPPPLQLLPPSAAAAQAAAPTTTCYPPVRDVVRRGRGRRAGAAGPEVFELG